MYRWFVSRQLDSAEKQIGVSLDYLREMFRVAPSAFFKFLKLTSLAQHRRVLPSTLLHVARMVASRHHDCGSCYQMAVNFALQDGMSVELVGAVVHERVASLPKELMEAYRFAENVVTNDGQDGLWRESIQQRFGDEGVVELSLAIAIAGVFPTMKRGMGYARSCDVLSISLDAIGHAAN